MVLPRGARAGDQAGTPLFTPGTPFALTPPLGDRVIPKHFPNTNGGTLMSFALLKDPVSEVQLLVRNDHVSAVEVDKEERSVTVHLLGGQSLRLTHEQSRQFLHHIKTHMHPAPIP